MIGRYKSHIIVGGVLTVVVGVIYVSAAATGNLGAMESLHVGIKVLLGLCFSGVAGGIGVGVETLRLRREEQGHDLEAGILENEVQRDAAIHQITNNESNFTSSHAQISTLQPEPVFDMKQNARLCNALVKKYGKDLVSNNKKPTNYLKLAQKYFDDWQEANPDNDENEYLLMLQEAGYKSNLIPSKIVVKVKPVTTESDKYGMTDVSDASDLELSQGERTRRLRENTALVSKKNSTAPTTPSNYGAASSSRP